MKNFDVIVIGSGSGLDIASFAAERGLTTALVEAGPLGGTCLNRGCIPSKMLIHAADVAETVRSSAKFGIKSTIESIDFAGLVERVSASVDRDSENIENAIKESANPTLYKNEAKFIGERTLAVGKETIKADKVFVVAGTRPAEPSIPDLRNVKYITSNEALRLKTLPKELIIIGGGYIAAEFAHFFGSLGSKIHVVLRGEKMLECEDKELAHWFTAAVEKKYNLYKNSKIEKVGQAADDQISLYLKDQTGRSLQIIGDQLLLATGRTSNADRLDVKAGGIETDEHGYIKINDYLETSVKNVWSLGDICGIKPLKHTANHQVGYAIRNGLLGRHEAVDYSNIGHAVFSSPQIAGVGKTENELKQAGTPYRVGRYEYKDTAMGEALLENGLVKVLLAENDDTILGCHIIGPEASILIHEVIVAMKAGGSAQAITDAVFVHPALPEVVQRAFYNVE